VNKTGACGHPRHYSMVAENLAVESAGTEGSYRMVVRGIN